MHLQVSLISLKRQFIFVSLFAGLTIFSFAQTNLSKEYQIKAVFLFNFAQFVEWPAGTFSSVEAPFVIGVLGKDPFGDYLDATVRDEKINGHAIVVKRFDDVAKVKDCHILFMTPKKSDQLQQILADLKFQNVLTVGDISNFAHQGGMIGFFTDNNKIKIQINPEVAKGAGLEVSSKLLRVSEIVSSVTN
jgi:hypothetical protein